MRGDEGATQSEVPWSSSASRRSDGYVWKQPGLPREIPGASRKGLSLPQGGLTAPWKSAEGVVNGGQARLVRHSIRKAEQQIGRTAKAVVEGPNGAPAEWLG